MTISGRIAFILAVLSLSQCANPVAPTGGPRDTTPPKVITEKSTPNEKTQFIPERIRLTFDEYIEVQNPTRNVIISPPLDPTPEYDVGPDYLEIDFSSVDSLQSNTTYTLNFDNAVADFNEGNLVENLLFVFSTGPYLDSLQLDAEVVNQEGAKQEGITVMLYDEMDNDSVVVNSLPKYFSKTNKQGRAQLRYLKGGLYKVFALKDENLTLKYDIPNASIGFLKEPVSVMPDTSATLRLELFTPKELPKLSRPPFARGNAVVGVFNPPDTFVYCSVLPSEAEMTRTWVEDSLKIWISPDLDYDSLVWVTDNGEQIRRDTIAVAQMIDTVGIEGREKSVQFKNNSATIRWNQPIQAPGDSVLFAEDTLGRRYYLKSEHHKYLASRFAIRDSLPFPTGVLTILPNQLFSVYGYSNRDTLSWNYEVLPKEELSELILQLRFPDSTAQYVAQLRKGNEVISKRTLVGQNEYIWELTYLNPGSYSVRIYEDSNKNGRRDGGDYWKGRQAERAREFSLQPLKPNWTLEEEIDWENETGSKRSN